MTIERGETIYNVTTGEKRTEIRTLELILTPEPEPEEGYIFEEWFEEVNGQFIQHWDRRALPFDSDEAISIILGEPE